VSKIRITDLRDPILTPAQRSFLEEAERNPVSLTETAVLQTAADRTGLNDFGSDDFRERLRVILGDATANSNLTELVKTTLFNRTANAAVNRLVAHDLLARHPEIHDGQIVAPIVIAGLPRSGTTHLLGLLSADSRLRSLPYWESLEPIPRLHERPSGVDPRYTRAAAAWDRLQLINPMMAPYHPMDADHIHEDLELQVPDFASYAWEWIFPAPRWRDHYLAHDQTPHYQYAKNMLKVMQWQDGVTRPWVLKCPQHLEQLGPLMTVYPDAVVVFTHRDPIASLQSIVTQLAYVIRTREKRVDPDWYLRYWSDRVERMLSAYVRDVERVPIEQRLDVGFDQLVGDDMATVERVYKSVGLPITDAARAEIMEYRATHQRYKYGSIDHDLRRDFGADPDELRGRFASYLARVKVPVEVR
jgi:hypothetical protein